MVSDSKSAKIHRKRALSLLEILLVLVLLAILFSMAMPRLGGFTLRNELTSAAKQVQTALTKAHSEAMRSGNAAVVIYQPQSGVYAWAASPIDQESSSVFETTQSTVIQVASREETRLRATDLGGESATRNIRKLPGEVVFVAANGFGQSDRTISDPDVMPGSAAESGLATITLPAIRFDPDGTSSDSYVVLSNVDGEQIAIAVRGLTGVTKISEVTSASRPFAAGGYTP